MIPIRGLRAAAQRTIAIGELREDLEWLDQRFAELEPLPEPVKFVAPEEPENPFVGRYRTGARLLASVARDFAMTPEDITGTNRRQRYTAARSVVCVLLKKWDGRSYPEVGRILGGRDHSTVINSARKFEFYCQRTPTAEQSYQRHLKFIGEARQLLAESEAAE